MQRARDRSRGKGQYVGLESKSFEAFLVFDTEPMLLVNDDQSELGERHVGAQYAVRADDDVDLARLEIGEDCLLLLLGLEATEGLDVDRKVGETLAEGARVLISEDRRRDQNHNLSTRLHGL